MLGSFLRETHRWFNHLVEVECSPECPYCAADAIREKKKKETLRPFERLCLQAICDLGDNAYGLGISARIGELQGKEPNQGSMYVTLDRLARYGLVRIRLCEGPAQRLGMPRKFYRLEPMGQRILGVSMPISPIEGETLSARIAGDTLAVNQMLYIAIGICFEAGYAHKQGITHGNITPENIMVGTGTHIRLINFQEDTSANVLRDIRSIGKVLREIPAGRSAPETLRAIGTKAANSRPDDGYSAADDIQKDLEKLLDKLTSRPRLVKLTRG